ncbi:hypothetical protein BDN72DRAFT_182134 [Pluteus cervinus]|uniref:Uncharacterized protein n=1 Tax=Pluteus cervinus TaxID=181527 RepID=A0ACD3B568_9AGAR|nr:hypothetical protein BDN72DRAFT_182134 [Pluteus cervinus]
MQETRADTMDSLDGLGEASVQRFPSYADWTQAQKPEEPYGMDEGEEPQQQERPDMESIPEADEGDAVAQGPVHDAQEEAGGSQETLLHHEQTPTPTQPVAQWIGSGSSVTVVQPHLETGADESKKPDRPSSIKSASPSPPSATSSKPKSAPTWSPVRPSPKAAVPTRTPESTVSSAPAELGSPEGVKAGEDTADVDMDVDGEEPAVGHDEGDDGNEQLPVDDDEEDEDDEEEEEDQDEPQADAEQEGGAVADDEDEDDILEYRDDDNLNPHLVPVSTLPAVAQGMSYPQIEHKVEEPDDIPESSDREEEDELLDDNDQQDEGPGYFVGQVQFEVQQPRAYVYEKVQQPEPGQPAYKEVHEELGQAYEEDQQPELGQPYGDDQVQEQNWQPEFEAVVEQDEDMDPEPYNDDERVLIEGAQELEFAPDDDEDEDGLGAEVVADPMSPEIPVQGLAHEPVAPQEEHDDAHDDEALDEPLKLNTFLDPDSAGHEDEPEADVTPTKAASIREESVELGAPPPQPITQLQPALPVVVAKPLSQVSSSTTKPPSATQLRPIVSLQAQQSSRPRRPIPLPIPRPDRSISPTKSGDSPLVPSFAPRVLAANSPLMSNRSHVSPTPSEASVRSGPPAPSEYYMSPPPPPPPPSSTALLTSMWDNESITEKGRRVFAPPSVSPPPPPSPQHEMSPELGMEEDSPSSSPLSSAPSSPERRAMPTSTAPTSSAGNENSEARRRDKAKGKAKEVAHTGTGEEDEPIVISSSDEEGEGEDEDDHQPVVSTSKKVDKGKGKARARDGDDSLDIKMEDLQAQMKQKGASTRDQGEGGGGEEGGEEPQAEEDEDESAMTDESDVIPIYKFKRRRRAIGKKTTSTNSGTVAGTPVPGAAAASVDGNASTKSIDDPIRRRLNKLAAGSGEAAGPSGGTGQIQPSAAATKVKKKRKLDLGGESPLEHVQKRVKMSRDHDSDEDEKYMKSKIASKKKGGRKEEVGEKKRGRPKKGTGKREKSTPDQSTEWPEQLTSEEDEFSQKFIGCDL